mmetsp:Transcript_17220/g.42234  ORF Transcript_17220/g.42234 Transcript_17220/m.42234 type:complete len:232 (-) Transcript_17220:279-974(-)
MECEDGPELLEVHLIHHVMGNVAQVSVVTPPEVDLRRSQPLLYSLRLLSLPPGPQLLRGLDAGVHDVVQVELREVVSLNDLLRLVDGGEAVVDLHLFRDGVALCEMRVPQQRRRRVGLHGRHHGHQLRDRRLELRHLSPLDLVVSARVPVHLVDLRQVDAVEQLGLRVVPPDLQGVGHHHHGVVLELARLRLGQGDAAERVAVPHHGSVRGVHDRCPGSFQLCVQLPHGMP